MQQLDQATIDTWLSQHSDWQGDTKALQVRWVFADFPTAISFMEQAVATIEELGHHPEWTNVYNRVDIRLTTHDAGNTVTDLDLKLAEALSAMRASNPT